MGIFNSKPAKDYEKVLTELQVDIKTRQNSLQRLKTFNRTGQVHLVLFSSVFYGGYVLYLFLQSKYIGAISKPSIFFAIIFPVSVFGIKKLINFAFCWLIDRHQVALKARQTKLKNRIEEIKVETKYYQTKDLIEKYEDSDVNANANVKKRTSPKSVKSDQLIVGPSRSQNQTHSQSQLQNQRQIPQIQNQRQIPSSPFLNYALIRPSSPPSTPNWMDRFMDAIIGDDSRNQKYALICAQCFNHNGLVPPEAFGHVRYRCPNCGFFNFNNKPKEVEGEGRIREVEDVKSGDKIDKSVKSDESLESDKKDL